MRLRTGLWLFPVILGLGGCGYNQIQKKDEQAAQAKQQISVQLQRRADLVPNLVNTVKGYAQHEEAVFTQVAQARAGLAGAIQTGDPTQMATANAQLTGALGRLIAVAEAYPQLKADQTFLRLQDELAGTENRIATARQDYNQAVNDYNAYIRQFPQTITAKVTGAKPRTYYEAAPGSETAPTVDFGTRPSGTAGTAAPKTP
ncbi:MAG: LemA family protein [Gemmatimonadetes bacterium]|nr:MAG: LemA family protein [Gemmatimonadota bacterium]PYP51186.1 MAG: LemA family protein [Gemmatimonadota bacterium]